MLKFSKLFKSGHSLAVCIPQKFIKELGIDNGDYIKLEYVDGKVIISKVEE